MTAAARVFPQGQLLTQTVAADVISSSGNFSVVQDGTTASNSALMFSIGDEGLFNLITKDSSGHNMTVNLSQSFNIPSTSTITAHSVVQDAVGTTYLAFSEAVGPGSPDRVHIMSPINVATFDWTQSDLTSYLLRDLSGNTPNDVVTIKDFLLV